MLKRILGLLTSILLVSILSGCGGGGGNPTPSAPPSPPINPSFHIGYYGGNLDSLSKTAPYISYYNPPDWGDWNTPTSRSAISTRILNEIQKAKDLDVQGIILDIGFTLFDNNYNYRGTSELNQFLLTLQTSGLDQRIIAVIVLDEPDLKISDPQYSQIINEIKPLIKWPLMVIYSDSGKGFPALSQFSIVGVDHYGKGIGVLRSYPQLNANQSIILLPGGADPWREDPRPFIDYACSHANVWGLVSFIYVDQSDGHKGIGTNGLVNTYNNTYKRCS